MTESSGFPGKELASECVKPLQEHVAQKMKVPFFASFVFSWLAINWEKLAILSLSKESIYNRIREIKDLPQLDWPLIGQWHTSTFFAPLVYSILITAFTPFITWVIKSMSSWANSALLKIQAVQDSKYESHIAEENLKIGILRKRAYAESHDLEKLKTDFETITSKYETNKSHLAELSDELIKAEEKVSSHLKEIGILESKYGGVSAANQLVDQLKEINEKLKSSLLSSQKTLNEFGEVVNDLKVDLNKKSSEAASFRARAVSYKEGLESAFDLLSQTKSLVESYINNGNVHAPIRNDYLNTNEYKFIESVLESLSKVSNKIYDTVRPTGSESDDVF